MSSPKAAVAHAGVEARLSYQGWSVTCACGWESPRFKHRHDANQALDNHIREAA